MALLFGSRDAARNATGDGYSGALKYVYNNGGLVLADLFSDPAMGIGTELANPVVADSAGRFPQVFLEGGLYDVVVKTSAGVTLYQEEAVSALGESAAEINRDFGNSRIAISGSGGVVQIEARPASGDDIGGSGRLGGSDGTQADNWEIDAAQTDVTGAMDVTGAVAIGGALDVTGRITEGTKKLEGVVYTEGSFSAVSSVDIPLPDAPTNVRAWVIEIIDLVHAATSVNQITGRLSYDGSTFKTGATDYSWTMQHDAGAGASTTTSTGAASMILNRSQGYETSRCYMRIEVDTVVSGSGVTRVRSQFDHTDTSGNDGRSIAFAGGRGNYGRAKIFRLISSAVTLTGRYRVIPLRGFGE